MENDLKEFVHLGRFDFLERVPLIWHSKWYKKINIPVDMNCIDLFFIFSLHMSTIIRSIENNIQFIAYVHIVLLLSLILLIVVLEYFFYISWFEWNTPKQTQPHWLWVTRTTTYTCLGEQLNYSYINLFTVYEVDIISIWLTDSATCPTQSKLVLYQLAQFP